ncbi:MAG: hypothetical protein J6J43_05460 [Oscillospiraceae bacterium]|nr:hypothetical protein [Oscillospiraceae bacterium]
MNNMLSVILIVAILLGSFTVSASAGGVDPIITAGEDLEADPPAEFNAMAPTEENTADRILSAAGSFLHRLAETVTGFFAEQEDAPAETPDRCDELISALDSAAHDIVGFFRNLLTDYLCASAV